MAININDIKKGDIYGVLDHFQPFSKMRSRSRFVEGGVRADFMAIL